MAFQRCRSVITGFVLTLSLLITTSLVFAQIPDIPEIPTNARECPPPPDPLSVWSNGLYLATYNGLCTEAIPWSYAAIAKKPAVGDETIAIQSGNDSTIESGDVPAQVGGNSGSRCNWQLRTWNGQVRQEYVCETGASTGSSNNNARECNWRYRTWNGRVIQEYVCE